MFLAPNFVEKLSVLIASTPRRPSLAKLQEMVGAPATIPWHATRDGRRPGDYLWPSCQRGSTAPRPSLTKLPARQFGYFNCRTTRTIIHRHSNFWTCSFVNPVHLDFFISLVRLIVILDDVYEAGSKEAWKPENSYRFQTLLVPRLKFLIFI